MALTADLYPYQVDPVQKFLGRGSLLVAYEMGLGKTLIGIAAAEELLDCGDISTCLIVVPASLKYQWAQQLAKFTDYPGCAYKVKDQEITIPRPADATVIDGPPAKRKLQYEIISQLAPHYVIMSYETVVNDARYVKRIRPGMVILDEASAIKTFRAQRTKQIKRMLRSPFRLALTGTPVENRPEELFSIMQWVDESCLGRYDLFDRAYIVRDMYGRVERYKNMTTLRQRLAPALARKSRHDPEVARFLPEVDTGEWYVTMTPKLRAAYKDIAADLAAELKALTARGGFDMHAYYSGGWSGDDSEEVGRIMARQQALEMVLDHPDLLVRSGMDYEESQRRQAAGEQRRTWPGSKYAYDKWQEGVVDDLFESPKLNMLKEKCGEILGFDPGNKIIIFTRFREMLDVMAMELLTLGCVQYHGGMNAQEKAAAIARFTSDERCRVFLSSDAGAYGNDMKMANYLINYDLPWSAGRADQRNGRHVRASSEFESVYVRNMVVEDTVEERKLATLDLKRRVGSAILDGVGADSQGVIENDVESLYKHLTGDK